MTNTPTHVGLHARRLKEKGPSAVREKAFAEQWQHEQNTDLLAYLLGNGNDRVAISQRDAEVAATVVQWLGTNVGQDFLDTVRQRSAELLAQTDRLAS